jgi:crotonobetainyl-CoA:carnitine CoA-transferase CaiB-like acyl-CoA transferase
MRYPLEGMKILDFTYLLPGPYGTMMLADLGADIIKVENLTNPDMMRIAEPVIDGVSAAYAHINRGKKSLAIDLKKEGAAEIIRRLLGEYDIILEQFRPGVMNRFGLGFDELKKIQPRLIYCSLTGYGQDGSYADRAGHDINYIALSGLASYSGRKTEGPTLTGIQIADVCSGSKNLVIALLAAYIRRQATGEGDCLDISITDGTYALTAFQAAGFLAGGSVPGPEADFLNGGSVYDYYRTSDGKYLSVGGLEAKFSEALYKTLGIQSPPSLIFASAEETERVKSQVKEKIAAKPLEHWLKVFAATDACVEPVRDMAEASSRAPVTERSMVVEVKTPKGTPLRQVGNPLKFRSGEYVAPFAGTAMGHHTGELLKNAGYSEGEIAELRKKGVVN